MVRAVGRRVRTALSLPLIGLRVPPLPGIASVFAEAAVASPDHPGIQSLQARWSLWRHRKESR